MTTRLTLDAFLAACPKQLIASHHKSERRIDLVNGSRVYFGSADRPGALEGTNLAWAWVDEARLVAAEAWRVIIGRVRDRKARRPQICVTTTPAAGWLEDEFNAQRADRAAFHGSTLENAGNLRPGFVEELRASYSPRLAKSLIDGEFSVLAGAVYEDFDDARHLIDWRFDARFPLWLSWDFGVRSSSILFAQVTGDFPVRTPAGKTLPPRSVVVFDELQIEEKPTAHQIPDVQRKLTGLGARPWRIVCDPAGKQRSQELGIPSVALLRAAFDDVVRWEEDVEQRHIPNRIARVSGALNPVEGEPTLYFARELATGHRRGVVRAVKGSVYEERGGRTSDHPKVDDFEHARDTLEYLVVHAQNQSGRAPRTTATGIGYGPRR